MVPSVDRVGRYFPLTVVAQWNADECAVAAACDSRQWFDAAEALAFKAPDVVDFDAFDASVAQLGGLIDDQGVAESSWLRGLIGHAEFPHRVTQWHVPLQSVHSLQRAVNALALREMERTLRPLSLWWSDGSNGVEAAWLCARGLPSPDSFAAMLSGEWSGTGWTSLGSGVARVAEPACIDVTRPSRGACASHDCMPRTHDAGVGRRTARRAFRVPPRVGFVGRGRKRSDARR